MNKDLRSTSRVTDKTIRALGSIAIKGTESLYNKDSSLIKTPLARRRISARERRDIKESLSERDKAIVDSVKDCRLIATTQIQRLHFTNYSTPYLAARACRRSLQQLTKQKILTRRNRRIGGSRKGSVSFIYSLGIVGTRIISPLKRLHPYIADPSEYFIKHTLEISELYTNINEAHRAGNFELLEVQTEPHCWRVLPFTSRKLRPDMFIRVAKNDTECGYFIEIDRDTTHSPAISKKLQQYYRFFVSGVEQRTLGYFPQVLWIVPNLERQKELMKIITDKPIYPPNLFTVKVAQHVLEYLDKHCE